jgi:phage portal protein BeeE
MPGWAGPQVIANVDFGTIGPTVTLSMAMPNLATTLQQCAWAYLAVTANASALAELPPVVQRYVGGQWTKDEDHPLNRLIRAPLGSTSSPPNWSWAEWVKVAAIHLQMSDVGFVAHVVRGLSDPAPIALWPAIFETLTIDESSTHWPTYYHHGTLETWPAAEVVHLRRAHPSSFTKSLSAFRAALPAIKIDAIARQRQEANLHNRIAPGVLITVKGLHTLSEEMKTKTKQEILDQVGLSTQDGTPMVGGEGWTLEAPPPNAGETGASPARQEARREVLAALGTPEVMVTTVEGDRSSMAERRAWWWGATLSGLASEIYGGLTMQLLPQSEIGQTRLWYDLSGTGIGLALLQERATSAQKLVDLGYPTNDAARRVQLDMPEVPALDVPNQKQVIAGHAPGDERPAPASDDVDADEAEA